MAAQFDARYACGINGLCVLSCLTGTEIKRLSMCCQHFVEEMTLLKDLASWGGELRQCTPLLELLQCPKSLSRHETYDAMFEEARQRHCSLEDVVTQLDSLGHTPLFLAVKERQHGALLMLLDLRADIDAGSNQSGWSPLQMASWMQDSACVEILVTRGASADHCCSRRWNFTLHALALHTAFGDCIV